MGRRTRGRREQWSSPSLPSPSSPSFFIQITELSNQLDSDASSDEGPQLSPPPRKVPSTSKNHCPPPTQTRHARPRTDSLSSSLSSTYTAASSQSQGPLHPHQKRSISPTASSVFSLSSEVSTATSFLNTSKLPLASFSPEQLADRLRLPPLSTREQTKADNLETIFTSDAFQQATSLENQTVPSNHYGGGGTSKLIEVDEEDDSYPTWETGSPPKDKTNEEEEDFGERLDELGEMMQIVRKGGSRKALKKLTALHEAGGGRTSSTSPPSKNHRNTSVESQSPEGTNKKRTYSSDLPLASSTTKKQKREKHAALPESESSGGGMGEVDELEVEAGTGFRKPYNLSEALQEVVGASRVSLSLSCSSRGGREGETRADLFDAFFVLSLRALDSCRDRNASRGSGGISKLTRFRLVPSRPSTLSFFSLLLSFVRSRSANSPSSSYSLHRNQPTNATSCATISSSLCSESLR